MLSVKSEFYHNNRTNIIKQLNGGLLVLAAHSQMQRGNDAAFAFEQEANFWYLCGIEEPDWWLIVDGQASKSWLVAPEIDEVHRVFEGGLSYEDALKVSGVNAVIAHKDAESLLRTLAKKHSMVYSIGEHPHKNHYNFHENPMQKKLWQVLERIFNSVQDCRQDVAKLRAIKQPEEIIAMKKAIKLTTDAFEIAKGALPNLRYEYEVEAEFDYYFKKHGVDHAYDPIVAGGKNACTLHYAKNSMKLKKNSLLLIDIGARFNNYSADISRTFAIGTPTARQTAVHSAVEKAHRAIVGLLKPGLLISEYQEKVDEIMKQALLSLDLITDNTDEDMYRTYFPHAVSHGLGIDTHDSLGGPTAFREGMVLTVEPGIYIPKEGIGVRIEDDILITKQGHQNLSGHLSTGL